MEQDPLKEIYRIKDELARESGYDIVRFFEQLDRWTKENPTIGGPVITAEELRQMKKESAAVGKSR